jgi:hypothetical protein
VDGLAERAVLCGFRESMCDGWELVIIEDASNVVHCTHIHNEMQASGGWDALCAHMQCRISVRQRFGCTAYAYAVQNQCQAGLQECWELSTKFQANLPCSMLGWCECS